MPDPGNPIVASEGKPREPLQCWGCGENHRLKDCPRRRDNMKSLHNLDNATTMEDMVRETPRICVTLED